MSESPAIGDLYKDGVATYATVEAMVDAYMADRRTAPFRLADGQFLDVAVAVQGNQFAAYVVRRGDVTEHSKRAAVRTAILLARPVKR
jgi:hypothetical protein